ncbi:hypothetical protein CpB0962 [Chlamydia pneumoniae TW-183]|uniref:Uncharacterized protein n=1 Tax=Chlamydia pneumoniae TaxID=83558 RepID=A0ABM5LDM6_CHLPN|nr:hypothetical protein CpB0962 [Chlamydia pneumoniae TW-183]
MLPIWSRLEQASMSVHKSLWSFLYCHPRTDLALQLVRFSGSNSKRINFKQ